MKVISKFILVLFTFCFIISCKTDSNSDQKDVDESEIRYRYYNLENQGWKSKNHTEKVDNIIFTAVEVPIVYYLLKERGDSNLMAVDSIYEENKTNRVIEFVFQDVNEDDLLKEKYTDMDYKKSVEYMCFHIEKDFFVITSKNDTINCSGVLFERSFKVVPNNKILLFFSKIKPDEKIQFVYKDKLFNKGILKFRFKEPILNL
jgi:hypothetical protein